VTRGRFAAGLAAVLLAAAAAILWGSDSVPMEPDESFYALIADNIRHGGNWLYLQHWWSPEQPYLDKPPLYFWLAAAADWAIGYRPLAFRLWSGLLAWAAVLATVLTGRALYGAAAGLLAGLLLATDRNFLFELGAHRGALNTGIACCAAFGLLAVTAKARPGRAAALLALAGAAAGWLKPLNGLIVLALALAAALCQPEGPRGARLRTVALAAGPVLAANLAWPALMWLHHGTAFLDYGLGVNVWTRFTRGVDPGHLQPWTFYVGILPNLLGLGWVAAAARLGLGARRSPADLIVCLVPFLYLAAISLSPSKLPQYAFPALPLLAVAGGAAAAQAAALLPRRCQTAALLATALAVTLPRAELVRHWVAQRPPLPWSAAGCPAGDPPGGAVPVLLAGVSAMAALEDEARNRELEYELRGFGDRVRLVDAAELAETVRRNGPALLFVRRGDPEVDAAAGLAAATPIASFPTRYGPPGVVEVLAVGLDAGCRAGG
jgi:4-amino-4-deoxy-L-arabinose transferase-like glycosyltransferase